jgi:hypothetical protein
VVVVVGAVLIAIGGVPSASSTVHSLASPWSSVVLILLTSFMQLTNNRAHVVLVSVVTVLLSLLLYLVFVLDHPFGPMGVTSEPFAHAFEVFDLVDQGS